MRLAAAVFAGSLTCVVQARAESGEMIFNENCAACHQVGGTGVPGEYPRLSGRADKIAVDCQGREFLAQLMITGMSGTITVDGNKILGIMPNFNSLPDEDLVAALNYVTGLGGRKAPSFSSADLKAARAAAQATPEQMAETRNRLAATHIVP